MSKDALPRPPIARKVPKRIVKHGDERVDDYHWFRDRSNPGVIEYIEAENRYTNEFMKRTEGFQKRLFAELAGRIAETDSTVPEKIGDFLYYLRTEKGKQYPKVCRRRVGPDAPEEVILDVNEAAQGNDFFNVDTHKVSPDHRLLAYLADTTGSERHTLFVKDLGSGRLLEDRVTNVSAVEWANDSKTILYSTMDEEYRPYKVFKHLIGTEPEKDVQLYHEEDPAFYYMTLSKTKTKAFIILHVESATTSEVHCLDANRPGGQFRVFRPRKHGVTYFVLHHAGRFFIVTNENAPNFKIMEAPQEDPSEANWRTVVPHRTSTAIDVSDPHPWVEAFRDHLVVYERANAIGRIRVIRLEDGGSSYVPLPENVCHVSPVETSDFDSPTLRFSYSSMVTPPRIYDYDMRTGALILRKQEDIPGFDASQYVSERISARAKDGTMIPVSLIHRKGLVKDGRSPCYLYGYGAYADFEGPAAKFNANLLSLLDRGFVCANAHIRGGGDLGRQWHKDGSMLTKINSFTDFIACAEHLVAEGYTSKDRLVARGKSAGGLLMGAVTNMRPDLFKVVIAEVPYVDAINTMLDPTIPMTVGEFEEWGNPEHKEFYDYLKLYSPYDNVERKAYPNMLVTAGLNDSRVQYWEPTKWVAKLRAMKTDDNIILLRTNIVEGHMGASGRYDHLRWHAFMFAYVLEMLGIGK